MVTGATRATVAVAAPASLNYAQVKAVMALRRVVNEAGGVMAGCMVVSY